MTDFPTTEQDIRALVAERDLLRDALALLEVRLVDPERSVQDDLNIVRTALSRAAVSHPLPSEPAE